VEVPPVDFTISKNYEELIVSEPKLCMTIVAPAKWQMDFTYGIPVHAAVLSEQQHCPRKIFEYKCNYAPCWDSICVVDRLCKSRGQQLCTSRQR